jgi:2-C-methyl-D-erythritol 2,4-cyclodiphosphate synthase
MAPSLLVGHGLDSHRLERGRRLVLAGVAIAAPRGAAAHSDGDVLLHALCDALLSTAGLGDIGQHFPDTDDQYRNADSMVLLDEVCTFLEDHSFNITHIDATLICEAPKLGPHRDEIRRSIAYRAGIHHRNVNVKFTTNEAMGFIGRGEGIAAMAIASLERE